MKKLETEEMSALVGGDWGDFIDGGCAALATASVGAIFLKNLIRVTPQGRIALLVADIGCIAWGMYSHS